MNDVSTTLKNIFQAHSSILLPGSGTYAMEASARQFCHHKRCLIIQNGYFGLRWHEILTQGNISSHITLLKAEAHTPSQPLTSHYAPVSIESIRNYCSTHKPEVVLMSHVDTSTGILVPHDYIKKVSEAAKSVGALVVLDCIASGCVWTPMKDLGLDAIITAPQKAFYAPASVGIVLLSQHARGLLDGSPSSSFTLDLKKWANVQEQYEKGAFAYHTTLPTVGIEQFNHSLKELEKMGVQRLNQNQQALGENVRKLLESKGLKSVSAPGFQAGTVLVYYVEDPAAVTKKFTQLGYRVAGGFGFFLGEPSKPKSFRIGLFGFDKLADVNKTTAELKEVIDKVFGPSAKL
uniref:alanine--glyoxylate transaminase n=1 Tax=Paramoeba aestuarina TaxID=180227 RepID=A0A7S4JH64_9EUKA